MIRIRTTPLRRIIISSYYPPKGFIDCNCRQAIGRCASSLSVRFHAGPFGQEKTAGEIEDSHLCHDFSVHFEYSARNCLHAATTKKPWPHYASTRRPDIRTPVIHSSAKARTQAGAPTASPACRSAQKRKIRDTENAEIGGCVAVEEV